MRRVLYDRLRNAPVELLAVSATFGLAVAGLLYFNWLIAVSRSALPY